MQGSDRHAIGLAAHLKTYDMEFAAHWDEAPGPYCAPAAARRTLRPADSEVACAREFSASAKRSMKSSRLRDILDICSDDAANSVELEVDCCTSSRMRSMALTTA